jgi:hypothetical protein
VVASVLADVFAVVPLNDAAATIANAAAAMRAPVNAAAPAPVAVAAPDTTVGPPLLVVSGPGRGLLRRCMKLIVRYPA